MIEQQARNCVEAALLRNLQRRLALEVPRAEIGITVFQQPAGHVDMTLAHRVVQRRRHVGARSALDQPRDQSAVAAERRMSQQRNTMRAGGSDLLRLGLQCTLDVGATAEHRSSVDRKRRALSKQIFGDRHIAHMRRALDRRLSIVFFPLVGGVKQRGGTRQHRLHLFQIAMSSQYERADLVVYE